MSCGNFSATTNFLKIAVIVMVLAFILLIVGYSLPRWSTLKIMEEEYGIGFDITYHIGLWKDCSCMSVLGSETCYCSKKLTLSDWLRAVQAMVTLGLIGVILSSIISITILFSRQDKTIRGINIFFAACSGLLIVIGVIIFGVENTEDFENLFEFTDLLNLHSYGSLSASFYLSTIAGALCLLVCVPLFVKDYLTPIQPPAQRINPMPVQYTNQGHVMIPPPGQTHVVVNTSVQQGGYMQQYPQAPAVYVPPGQQVQGQYGYPTQSQQQQHQYGVQYPPQQQQYGVQYPQQNSNQHLKS